MNFLQLSRTSAGMEDEDVVVKEVDVFLTKNLEKKLWLLQYPVRPNSCTYENNHFVSSKVKPEQKRLSFEVALDTSTGSYSTSKGEHLAMSVDGPNSNTPIYPSGKLDKISLVSAQSIPNCKRFAIGALNNGQLHLTPLTTVLQMRPDLDFLDKAEAASKARAQLLELEGDSSQDEEEEVKAVTVKFARQETAEQRSRRMQSYDYLQKKLSEETWINCTYLKSTTEVSHRLQRKLLGSVLEPADAYCDRKQYLEKLIPKQQSNEIENPDMPINVLSKAQLKNMPLSDQVRAIVTNAKAIKWSQLLTLLEPHADQSLVIKALQQVAVLVQGCWVVKSDILYPKDSFSPHSSSPAEVICRARDFLLWKFTHSRAIIRRDISNIVKIPPDEMKEMLEQVAQPRAKHGWQFTFEFDHEFVDRYKDVVQRQQMLWDAKYQQLAKHFKLPKDPKLAEMSLKRRRRHSSRSKSRSDMSDTDGEKTPNLDVKKEFNFESNDLNENGDNAARQKVIEDLRSELSILLREKLITSTVLSLADIKSICQERLAQHPSLTALSDSFIEQLILSAGSTKISPMGPPGSVGPFYLLTTTGDADDEIRHVIAEVFQSQHKIQVSQLKSKLDERGIPSEETHLKTMLKSYCVFKGCYWYLKGTAENGSF